METMAELKTKFINSMEEVDERLEKLQRSLAEYATTLEEFEKYSGI